MLLLTIVFCLNKLVKTYLFSGGVDQVGGGTVEIKFGSRCDSPLDTTNYTSLASNLAQFRQYLYHDLTGGMVGEGKRNNLLLLFLGHY